MRYNSGAEIVLEFDLESEENEIFITVENESGDIVGTFDDGSVLVDIEGLVATVTVLGAVNTLETGVTRAHRIITLSYTSDGFVGTRSLEQDYILQTGMPLALQVNSFQTYGRAMMTASDLTEMSAFQSADRSARITALYEAWVRLCRLNYSFDRESDQTRIHNAPGSDVWSMVDVTAEEFVGFPDRFQQALQRAQVIEANELLAGGGAARKRLDGILSSTIGETSQMFRTGKPVTYVTSARALRELRGYVSFAVRLARA